MCLLNRSDKKQHSWKLLYLYLCVLSHSCSKTTRTLQTCVFRLFCRSHYFVLRWCENVKHMGMSEKSSLRCAINGCIHLTAHRYCVRIFFYSASIPAMAKSPTKRWLTYGTPTTATTTTISHSIRWKTHPLNHIPLGNVCMAHCIVQRTTTRTL